MSSVPEDQHDDEAEAFEETKQYAGRIQRGSQSPRAKRNFFTVAAVAVGIGMATASAIAVPTYLVYKGEANAASMNAKQSDLAKARALDQAEQAELQAKMSLGKQQEAERQAEEATRLMQVAKQEADAALRSEKVAVADRVEAARVAAEAKQAAEKDRAAKLRAEQLAGDAIALDNQRAMAEKQLADAKMAIAGLQDSVAGASLNDPAARELVISTLESILSNSVSQSPSAKRARQLADLGQVCLRHAVSLHSDETARNIYADKAGNAYSDLRRVSQAIKDRELYLEAIYGTARAFEISKQLESSLMTFQEGLDLCEKYKLKAACARFISAVVRLELSSIEDVDLSQNKIGSKTFTSLVQRGTSMEKLQRLLALARRAVDMRGSPGDHLQLGRVWILLGESFLESKNNDRAIESFSRALATLESGIRGLISISQDIDTQGETQQQLYLTYVSAETALRKIDSTLSSIESYKRNYKKLLRTDESLSHALSLIANEYGVIDMPATDSPGFADWMTRLSSKAKFSQAEKRSLKEAEAAWGSLAKVIAEHVEFQGRIPPVVDDTGGAQRSARVNALANATREYFESQSGYTDTIGELKSELKTMQDGESTWAKFYQGIGAVFGLRLSLPDQDVRWTANRAQTEKLMNDLLFKISENADVPDAPFKIATEEYFGTGLHFFFDDKFEKAIEFFDLAIEIRPRDARFYYFRGLARKCSGKFLGDPDADMMRGQELESIGLPSSSEIAVALIRVQGEPRKWVESYRHQFVQLAFSR